MTSSSASVFSSTIELATSPVPGKNLFPERAVLAQLQRNGTVHCDICMLLQTDPRAGALKRQLEKQDKNKRHPSAIFGGNIEHAGKRTKSVPSGQTDRQRGRQFIISASVDTSLIW